MKSVKNSTVSKNKFILAIDLGTSGPKVALITVDGELFDWEREATSLILLPGGGAEQCPDDWWRAITNAARRLFQRHPSSARNVSAVSCTAQWSGTVAVDKQGKHLMNAFIWLDSRGALYAKNITGGILTIQGYDIFKLIPWLRYSGGIAAHSGKDSIAHIWYIQHELPHIYERAFQFLEPKDYLNLRLTGEFAASYDSIALHWLTDNRKTDHVAYNERLLRLSQIDRSKLPDLKPATAILGTVKRDVAAELGLENQVPVIVGTPDLQSAIVGSGAMRHGEGHLSLGTSSFLTCLVPFKKVDLFHNMTSLPFPIPNMYFIANEQECAGVCISFLKTLLSSADKTTQTIAPTEEELDEIAARVSPGSGSIIFTPWLYGERTPVEDRTLRGGFHNLSLQTTREQVIRSVYEGVAYNTRWLLQFVERFAGERFTSIAATGGGAQSNVWCQIHADVLGRPVRQVENPRFANAHGAALLAAAALGYISFNDIPSCVRFMNTYEPNMVHNALYENIFKEFVGLYRNNKKMHRRLNSMAERKE